MKKMIIALLALGAVNSYAMETKVICVSSGYNNPAYDAVQKLNEDIKKAVSEGFTQVSAPAIGLGNEVSNGVVCVTISKP